MSAQIASLSHSLDSIKALTWTAAQEKSISRDYPFSDLHEETPDQYVVRTYLQFLWLPQSIMPLNLFIPSLLRVKVASSSQPSAASPHPLHDLLEPLLLTARATSNKYHVELPQILVDGGGAGEVEETMMWFALNHEKADDDDPTRSAQQADGPWVDEKWRSKWLDRMERREVQIQVLLHFLKLSLPGRPPLPTSDISATASPSVKKRKRSSRTEPKALPAPSLEDTLESYMDKLSMWQLVGGLDTTTSRPNLRLKVKIDKGLDDDRDWMQVFCEEVVEQRFKSELPDFCALFHSKVFPTSPFSDDSSAFSDSSRSPSPDSRVKRAKSSVPSRVTPDPTRHPSPALSSTSSISRTKSTAKLNKTGGNPAAEASRLLARSRSRSLSVSLAQEKANQRAGSTGPSTGAGAKKRILSREVSMSRVFKGKSKAKPSSMNISMKIKEEEKEKAKLLTKPVRRDEGVTLVDATPTKARPPRTQSFSSHSESLSQIALFRSSRSVLSGREPEFDDDDEEEWEVQRSSSPGPSFLRTGHHKT